MVNRLKLLHRCCPKLQHRPAGPRFRSRCLPRRASWRVESVFFGGGTPSLTPLPELGRVLEAVAAAFDLSPAAEVTLEANPGTVDERYLRGLRALGVNRLSLGVQSFADDELRLLD